MANDEVSLETRASAAYVQGQLEALIEEHSMCDCSCFSDLRDVLNEWKQAEAELADYKHTSLHALYQNLQNRQAKLDEEREAAFVNAKAIQCEICNTWYNTRFYEKCPICCEAELKVSKAARPCCMGHESGFHTGDCQGESK